MAVTIQIGVDRLNDPSVAKALANLVLALGGAATGQKKPAEAPAPKVEAPAAPAEAPAAPEAAPAAPEKAPSKRTRKAAAPAAPAAEAPAAPAAGGDDAAARYEAFVENLPERSRAFLDLLRQRGTLTINEAMDALDISVPKAMGGITGSIGRWAPVRGVPIPYEASMVDGVRTWTWTGGPEGASPTPAKKTRKAGAKKGRKPAAPAKQTRKAAAKKPEAAPAADEGDLAQRYRDFVANLPERSQQFIELVRDRKVLTITEAMEALDLSVPKAMGGITGSIGRWAPVRGIPVPYEAITIDGERAWKWVGSPEAEGASPKAEAPAGVTPETAAPEGAFQADEVQQAAVDAIIDALPERQSLFIRTLRQREMMTMQEVLDTFSLAKARAVSGIVDPILAAFRDADVEPPFVATFAPTGDKAWVWSKAATEAPAEEPATDGDASDERGVSAARPGVRVRRRAR